MDNTSVEQGPRLYPEVISRFGDKEVCKTSSLVLTKHNVERQHSLFRSLAVCFCGKQEDYEFLLGSVIEHIGVHMQSLKFRLTMSWLRDFGTFQEYSSHTCNANDCTGTIEMQVFCYKYNVTVIMWDVQGSVLQSCGSCKGDEVVIHICKTSEGYYPLTAEGQCIVEHCRCSCNGHEHFRSADIVNAPQNDFSVDEMEACTGTVDSWENITAQIKNPWTAEADFILLEEALLTTYKDTCLPKHKYTSIKRDNDSTFFFMAVQTKFGGFMSAWSAAICREYVRYRIPGNEVLVSNFPGTKSQFWEGGHFVANETLERFVHWQAFLIRYCAKKYILLAKENCTIPCAVCNSLHFRSNVVTRRGNNTRGRKRGHEPSAPMHDTNGESIEHTVCQRCVRQKVGFESFSEKNGMCLPHVPDFLQRLNQLEERLVSPFLAFMKMKLLRSGQQRALVGGVVVVPLDTFQVVKELPQTLHMCQAVVVCLKRKLQFKHAHLQDHVRVGLLKYCLRHLVETSPLYLEMRAQYSEEAFQQLVQEITASIDSMEGTNNLIVHDVEEENLAQDHCSFFAKCPTYELPGSDVVQLAPCENKKPTGVLSHDHMEELLFPTLYGGQARASPINEKGMTERNIIQWELLHKDRRYAQHIENIFFKYYKLLVLQVNSVIWTRSRQSTLQHYQASQLRHNELLQSLFSKGLLYNEFKRVRGSPQYWAEAKRNLFAMIRQLKQPPTFFLSLSMADTHWYELIGSLVFIAKGTQPTPEEVADMSFDEKMSYIRNDPVTCARYFHHRRRAFIKYMLKEAGILGTLSDYFGVVEFQFRGSPHLHMLIWIDEAAALHTAQDEKVVCKFIDEHIQCDSNKLPVDLRKFQTHNHSHRCRRGRKGQSTCSFGFPRPPMPETRILSPLPESIPKNEVKALQALHLHMIEILQNLPEDHDEDFDSFLKRCGISTTEHYYKVLRSKLTKSKVFHSRTCKDRFINPFNTRIVHLWKANMDIQFCLHPHAVGHYIANYMCKGNKALSKVLHDTMRSLEKQRETLGSALRLMANDLLRKQEISIQEAVFHILSLPLRFSSRGCQFINTNTPDKRVVVLKPAKHIEELPDNAEVFNRNAWIEHYEKRGDLLQHLCLADFVAWYSVTKKKDTTPRDDLHVDEDEEEELNVEDQQRDNDDENGSEERKTPYRKRKRQRIIRFVNFPRDETCSEFLIERLLLFLPFTKESEVLVEDPHALYMRHREQILAKEQEYCPHYDSWEKVLQSLDNANEENDLTSPVETFEDDCDAAADIPGLDTTPTAAYTHQMILKDSRTSDETTAILRSLNEDQRDFVHHVMHHIRTATEPLKLFLSGGAGVGKSRTIEALYELLTRHFSTEEGMRSDSIKVLKMAPTGVAAFNIGGYTIHAAMRLGARPLKGKGPAEETYPALGSQALHQLEYDLKDVRVVIIDEISMTGGTILDHVDGRWKDIRDKLSAYGGVHLIVVGDLYQLAPCRDQWCFEERTPNAECSRKVRIKAWWKSMKMFELTKIMRQKDNMLFAERLNRLREGKHTHEDSSFFSSLQRKSAVIKPDDIMHLFCTNKEVADFNRTLFNAIPTQEQIVIPAEDASPSGGRKAFDGSDKSIPAQATDTQGLPSVLQLYRGCTVMVTTNVNVKDGLVNGSCGVLKEITYGHSGKVHILWVHFFSPHVGAEKRALEESRYRTLPHVSREWTPVERVERRFPDVHGIREISRKQFPLGHRNASTIHKTQGLTLKSGVVSFSGRKVPGLVYVGLSRFESPDAVQLVNFDPQKIATNMKVKEEMERLRCEQLLQIVPTPIRVVSASNGIKLCYQNVRSLRCHYEDLMCEPSLAAFDFVSLVETHCLHAPWVGSAATLPPHVVFSKNEKFGCALLSRQPVTVCYEAWTDVSDVLCVVLEQRIPVLVVCTVYLHPKCSIHTATHVVSSMLSALETIADTKDIIVVGDFNAEYGEPKFRAIRSEMDARNIFHIQTGPTTVSGSTIDHMWRSSTVEVKSTTVHECWYSDHFPMSLVLTG